MRIFLLLALTFLWIQPAFAQSGYVPPREAPIDPPRSDNAQDDLNELLGKKRDTRQPETLADYTYLHYRQCLDTEHPILNGRDLERMCSCTAGNFRDSMTLENIREIENETREGVLQKNRLMYFVYGPCVKPTLNTMLINQCINNKKNELLMKHHSITCTCIAQYVSERIGDHIVPQLIEHSLSFPNRNFEPLAYLINTDIFDKNLRHYSNFCIRNIEK